MAAEELFAVIVRAIGLTLMVAGILALGIRVIDYVMLPSFARSGYEGSLAVTAAFIVVVGILLLFLAGPIVRLFYAKGRDS